MNERDRATAAALQIAYENHIRLGWKFSAEDIGKSARSILDAFDNHATPKPNQIPNINERGRE